MAAYEIHTDTYKNITIFITGTIINKLKINTGMFPS
jgi:hypothetical protein